MLKTNLLTATIIGLCLTNINTAFGVIVSVGEQNKPDSETITPSNKNAVASFEEGVNLYEQGDLKGAEAAFRKAIELQPNFAKAYIGLGNTLDDQGKPTEAIAQYKK
ncbi:MAG: tetratricopeptide repeat protein, partial [Hassallia sp.]